VNGNKRVYCIGIGGTGMGSLAGLLAESGFAVSGSDAKLYPPMSDYLAAWKIPVHEGYDARHVQEARPDLVVIGNVIRADNPEARAALDADFAVRSFSDALFELAIAGKHSIVVAGTHGKTTTTSLVAVLLDEAGLDPAFLIGGIASNFDSSFHNGKGPHFVVEGDEYDTAFFDKTPKFLHYGAQTLVITSVEFDHADIYRDLAHVKSAFRELVARMPADGRIVAAVGQLGVREVVADAPCPVLGYGVLDADVDGGAEFALTATQLEVSEGGTAFEFWRRGRSAGRARVSLCGRHNVENALAALLVAELCGVSEEVALRGLAAFRGVKRRQEIRGTLRGITVIDDFAHHPTAVRETLLGLRTRYPERRLLVAFEPRTNTSRRKIFQKDYADTFAAADNVAICEVADTPIYSATGEVTERFSAEELARDLRARGKAAVALPDADAIAVHLLAVCSPGDVIVVMSNGSFGNLCEKLLMGLRK